MTQLTVEIIQEGGLQIVEVLHPGPRGAKGDPGETLVLTGPALAGRASGSGNLVAIPLAPGLAIVNGALTLIGVGSGTVTSVGLTVPNGFSVANSPITESGTLAVTFATGYSLPTTAKQGQWDQAYADLGQARPPSTHKAFHATGGADALTPGDIGAATAAQGVKADTAIQPGNAALSDTREWSAETISQAEAEAGSATTRRAFTAQRVFQAVAAWWAGSASKTKLDGIANGATANSTDAQLRDRSTHSGTQTAATISDFAASASAAAPVQSVAGRTGTVTLAKGDVGLSNVDDTSDANKPISTATAAALAGKVDTTDGRLSDARTPTAHNQAWSTITATPTTLSGYGITDAFNPAIPGAIGGTTPAAGTFTSLSANSRLNLPSGAPVSPAARDVYAVANTLRYRDSTGAERLLLNAMDNLANLADPAVARTNLRAVGTVTTGITGAAQITNIVSISQSNYDAIPTKDAQTLYVISG